jgi:hypothetical protein
MEYSSTALLIPLFAAIYLMTVYALLKIAEIQGKKKPTSSGDIGSVGH